MEALFEELFVLTEGNLSFLTVFPFDDLYTFGIKLLSVVRSPANFGSELVPKSICDSQWN